MVKPKEVQTAEQSCECDVEWGDHKALTHHIEPGLLGWKTLFI